MNSDEVGVHLHVKLREIMEMGDNVIIAQITYQINGFSADNVRVEENIPCRMIVLWKDCIIHVFPITVEIGGSFPMDLDMLG